MKRIFWKYYDAGAGEGGGGNTEIKAVADAIKDFKSEQKAAVEAVQKATDETKAAVVTLDEAVKANQPVIDAVALFMKEQKAATAEKTVHFSDALGEQLTKAKDKLSGYKSNRVPVNLELKLVGNMAAANLTTSGTQNFVDPTRLGGVGRKPYELTHLRDILRVQPIQGDSAYVIRDAAGEGGPTAVAAGVVKPQSDRDYVKLIVPVTKIAHYFKIPEEMLEDVDWLRNEISAVGVEDLLAKEDDLILNQVGAAGLFAGLTTATNSTAFAAPASLALAIDLANNYDVLVAAWTQLRILKNSANYALCNPADYARMVLTKESATNGAYVFGAPNIAIPNIFGIPLIPHTAITSDKFLLGDFSKVALGQRAGISVRFYDQNEDDAIKNMVTVVIEERLTVVADRADRLIYGDFSDGRAALETA